MVGLGQVGWGQRMLCLAIAALTSDWLLSSKAGAQLDRGAPGRDRLRSPSTVGQLLSLRLRLLTGLAGLVMDAADVATG